MSWSDIEGPASEEGVDEGRFLIFRLGGELYGTPLLGVREVAEPQRPKPVPNTASYFMGVINIRGQIVGMIDLRARFGYASEAPGRALLVFETEAGAVAAVVDAVEAVARIEEQAIERRPGIATQVPIEFLLGVTTFQERLVTLIDLDRTLSSLDYVSISKGKMVA